MYIIPAIDLKEGKCVRLFRGDYSKETVYSDNPVEQAKVWEEAGARIIHVVDLDGAKNGTPANRKIVEEIALNVSCKVEMGGGIRNLEDIEELLSSNVWRIIIGSKAIEDPDFVYNAIKKFGHDKIVVGLDARKGFVSGHGWTKDSNYKIEDFIMLMYEQCGVRYMIYTDIMKDGTLEGPNIESFKEILELAPDVNFVCSGGIGKMDDIKSIKQLADKYENVEGVIVGKSLYDGAVDLKSAIKLYQTVGD